MLYNGIEKSADWDECFPFIESLAHQCTKAYGITCFICQMFFLDYFILYNYVYFNVNLERLNTLLMAKKCSPNLNNLKCQISRLLTSAR